MQPIAVIGLSCLFPEAYTPEDFWKKQYDKEDEKGLHNFLWLNLIDRKNDGLIIQKIIMVWINNNKKYKKNIWNSTVVSRRIIAWIMNSDILLVNWFNSDGSSCVKNF